MRPPAMGMIAVDQAIKFSMLSIAGYGPVKGSQVIACDHLTHVIDHAHIKMHMPAQAGAESVDEGHTSMCGTALSNRSLIGHTCACNSNSNSNLAN